MSGSRSASWIAARPDTTRAAIVRRASALPSNCAAELRLDLRQCFLVGRAEPGALADPAGGADDQTAEQSANDEAYG